MRCSEKIFYHTQQQAEEALAALIAENPKDPRNKFLRVYVCNRCGLFHVGHVRAKLLAKPVPAPKVKGPTLGEQRRAAKRKAEKAKHDAAFADYHNSYQIAQALIDCEIKRYIAMGRKPGRLTDMLPPNSNQ